MNRGAMPSFSAVRVSLADLSCATDMAEAGTPRPDTADAASTGRTETGVNGKDADPSAAGGFTLRAYVRQLLAVCRRKAERRR